MKAYFRQVITVEADELPDNITAAQLKDMAKPDGLLDYMIRRGALRCTTSGWVVTSTTPNLTRGDRRVLNDKTAKRVAKEERLYPRLKKKRKPYTRKAKHWTQMPHNKAKLRKLRKKAGAKRTLEANATAAAAE